jgi:hypothetical protein
MGRFLFPGPCHSQLRDDIGLHNVSSIYCVSRDSDFFTSCILSSMWHLAAG